MAREKAPAFQFYARDYMADPAVQRLTWDQRGRYHWALCCSSLTETPGVASESDWAAWMGYDDAGWVANREAHARCFAIENGRWVQRRMRSMSAESDAYRAYAKNGGHASAASMSKHERGERAKKAAAARWGGKSTADACPMLTDAYTASASASALEPKTHSVTGVTVRAPEPESKSGPDDLSWIDLFERWFWSAYPRRIGKPAALRAWKAVKPQNQATIDAIAKGLAIWVTHWTEPRFTPHPSTWLNQRRWEDTP